MKHALHTLSVFFPSNQHVTNFLEWANDVDRETYVICLAFFLTHNFVLTVFRIIDILTQVFRLKSFSDYVKEKKQIRDRERERERYGEANGSQRQKPKRVKKRTWKLRVSTLNLFISSNFDI
jgi:hypothetical protein